MESSRFTFLPDEINLQFPDKLSYSDLIHACQEPGLSHLCDWDFWRRKAEKELNVPEWYFNLPLLQNRKVSGDQRFLEISSKFRISAESIAKIKKGKVIGIYTKEDVKFLATHQGEEHVFPLKEWHRKRANSVAKLKRAGVPNPANYLDMPQEELFRVLEDMERYSRMIQSGNVRLLRKALNSDLPKRASLLCGMLVAIGDEKLFPLVEEYFAKEDTSKTPILKFSMMSHKSERFIKLFSKLESIAPSVKTALLSTAYFTANIECISFLENLGAQLDKEGKFYEVDAGYLYNPRPVEVYQIVQELGSRRTSIPSLQGIETDVDIRILQIGNSIPHMQDAIRTRQFIVPLVRYYLAFFKQEGEIELLRKLCRNEESEIKAHLFAEIDIRCSEYYFPSIRQQSEVAKRQIDELVNSGRFAAMFESQTFFD